MDPMSRPGAADLGDRVLLQGGQTFEGTHVLDQKHGGTSGEKAVVLSSWGNGTATIDGGKQSAITLTGSRWVTLRNLQVHGRGDLPEAPHPAL